MDKKQKIIALGGILIFIIVLAYIITCAIFSVSDYFEQKEAEKQEKIRIEQRKQRQREELQRKRREEQKRAQERQQNTIHIKFNTPSALSFKSKEEIYKIRKQAVSNSIFSNPNYEPSEEVFGQIESGKPWNSMKQCKYKETRSSDINGPSEEARYINNPELLVGVEYAFYDYYCGERRTEEMPFSTPAIMYYDKEKNIIETTFISLPYCTEEGKTWYNLKGLNARDLGYKYAYVDREKSSYDINFVENENASNSIIEFQDYIHVGGSCGHESGCNNASPNQPPLNFYYSCDDNRRTYDRNKTIHIKLWKNMPDSPDVPADITQIIRFKRL